MGIRFLSPLWLLLSPPLIVLVWRVSQRSLAGMNQKRRIAAASLRTIIVAGLTLALAGPQAVTHVRELCVMYVLDASKSVSSESSARALEWARRSQRRMRAGDSAGLIVFGRETRLDTAPSPGALPKSFHAIADGSATNIATALRLAMASFPDGVSRHIVLLSDGNETIGSALDQARIAGAGGVTMDSVPVSSGKRDEAWVESLGVPSRLKEDEPFDARVVVGSNIAQTAELRLYRDGQPAGSRTVSLGRGRTVFLLPQKAGKSGSRHYQVELEPGGDTEPDNNKGYAFAMVAGKARVMLATRDEKADEPLIKALRAAKISAEVVDPTQIPSAAAEFGNVNGLILSNVPATDLSASQMIAIRGAVRQLGTGLAMIGGPDSFGAGGYFQTPVEEALPVRMTIRKQRYIPSMTLLIIIDKSGSMGDLEHGIEKIRLANEAAVACIDTVQPRDQIGVIACDSDPKLVAPIWAASERERLAREIRSIRAGGGGIMVYPSLVRANQLLSEVDTTIRHVILLADGSDAEDQDNCVELARRMAATKITVTVVAIGKGPDVPFLTQVARAGKGGFYLTENARDLPKIFTKDTLLASRSLLVEEPFRPVARAGMEPIEGLDLTQMPPLLGYVATTPKETATQAMLSPKGDPVLATWQFGLGRSLAFTSDARARWAARWLGWSSYPSLWAQSARWIMRRSRQADWQASVEIKDGAAHVTAEATRTDGSPLGGLNLKASAVLPDGKTVEATLEQTGPGRYEASIPAWQTGDYIVNVTERGGSGSAHDMATGSLAYPEEYRTIGANLPLLRQIAEASGGKFNPAPEDVFARTPRTERRYTDLWRFLTLMALLLLPLDIAIRRLVFSQAEALEVARKAAFALPRRRRRPVEPQAPEPRLLRRKRERAVEGSSTRGADGAVSALQEAERSTADSQVAASPGPTSESAPGAGRSRLLDSKRRRRE